MHVRQLITGIPMEKTSRQIPIIGITMGDPVGIGPEIIVKALSQQDKKSAYAPVVIGDRALLEREINKLQVPLSLTQIESPEDISSSVRTIHVLPTSRLHPDDAVYAQPTKKTGQAMASYIIQAVKLAQEHKIDAIVTAPINKKSLQDSGHDYPGHTEMLARLTDTQDVVMMLVGTKLRVVLITIHCAISRVPKLLSVEKINKTITITHKSLKTFFAISSPRIAVAGLNPHAGEGGVFGNEEQDIIVPAIQKLQREGIDATGPYPPDTLFYYAARGRFDAVVCMYHDQGLIPLKLLHFEDGVNVTLGLPLIRTSVDHGTAYDIAGKASANPASLLSAIDMAVQMARKRKALSVKYKM